VRPRPRRLAHPAALAAIAVLLAAAATAATADPRSSGDPPRAAESPAGRGPEDPLLARLLDRNRQRNGYATVAVGGVTLVDALWGDLAAPAPGGPVETGREFLRTYGPLLGFPERASLPPELGVLSSVQGAPGTVVVLAPMAGRVPYLWGSLVMAFDARGTLVGVTGRHAPMPQVVRAGISATEAVKRALAEIRKKLPGARMRANGKLQEILDPVAAGTVHHRFMMDVVVGTPPRPRRVVVDGEGRVVNEGPGHLTAGASGLAYTRYPTRAVEGRPLAGVEKPFLARLPWTLKGPHFTSASSFPVKARSSDGRFLHMPALPLGAVGPMLDNPAFLETNVWHHLQQARDRALQWGASEVEQRHVKYDVWQPPDLKNSGSIDNAYYSGGDDSIHFAGINIFMFGRSPAIDASVICHEYGHLVETAINPGWWYGGSTNEQKDAEHEARAVGEGFADFFASSVTGHSKVGLMCMWPLDRNAVNDYRYPERARKEIHAAGELFSGLCWDLREKIGPDDTARLVIAGIRAARTPVTFRNAAIGIVQADAALYAGRHHADIGRVLALRGLDLVVVASAAARAEAGAAREAPAGPSGPPGSGHR
jgi:hypothetical protein